MKNILASVDLSPISGVVVEAAGRIAQRFGAKLWLIHVAQPEPDFVGFDAGPPSVREHRAEAFREEHRQLQQFAAGLSQAGVDVTPLLVQGSTVEKIMEEAHRLEADLIVLGGRRHGAIYRALAGSVCDRVVHDSPCPVLIVPQPDPGSHPEADPGADRD